MLHQHKSHLPPSECTTAGGGVKSFRLGDNTRQGKGGGGCVVFFAAADVITGGITRDQYVRRKDNTKGRMDPMSRLLLGLLLSLLPPERNVGIANNEVVIATRRNAPVITMMTTATKI
jgi:hypothetical protein